MAEVLDVNVADPALYRDDTWQPVFARLRDAGPLHRCSDSLYGPYWSVVDYALTEQVELDTATYSNRADLGGIQVQDIDKDQDRPSFLLMDPPEHTGRRRAVAPMTTNRSSLEGFSHLIRERTAAVLDTLPRGEVFDWVDLVSTELTGMMLATMFDFPQEHRRQLIRWSDIATANLNAENPPVKTEAERFAVLQSMADAFAPMWHERVGGDGFDLMTMLANADATKDMDREEFIGTLFLLIVGGNDTTRNSMSGGLVALHDNPQELEKVRADRSLIPTMVQEMIRYQTPVVHMRRTALADAELAGQHIAKGDKVVLWYVSSNRDEAVFPDAERFLADRENARRHMAFGIGVHRCVGDRLAALQLRILWEEILDRDMRIEVVGPGERVYSNFLRGFAALPVRIAA